MQRAGEEVGEDADVAPAEVDLLPPALRLDPEPDERLPGVPPQEDEEGQHPDRGQGRGDGVEVQNLRDTADNRQVDVTEDAAEQTVDLVGGVGDGVGGLAAEQTAHHRQLRDAQTVHRLAKRAGEAADELGQGHVDLQDPADGLGQERVSVAADAGLGAADVDVELGQEPAEREATEAARELADDRQVQALGGAAEHPGDLLNLRQGTSLVDGSRVVEPGDGLGGRDEQGAEALGLRVHLLGDSVEGAVDVGRAERHVAAEDVHVDNLAARRSTVLVSDGGGVGVGHTGGRDKRRREQGRPACNPQSAKLAHLLLFSFQSRWPGPAG